jgi:hypothetical protein
LIHILQLALVLGAWELNWRGYSFRAVLALALAYAVTNWIGYSVENAFKHVEWPGPRVVMFPVPLESVPRRLFFGFLFGLKILVHPTFLRGLPIAAFAWFTGGVTRRLFGAGPRYSLRLPSLTEG